MRLRADIRRRYEYKYSLTGVVFCPIFAGMNVFNLYRYAAERVRTLLILRLWHDFCRERERERERER